MLCCRAGGHSGPPLHPWGLSLHSPQLQPGAWGRQPQRAWLHAWRMASTCCMLSCALLKNLYELEASFWRQILKMVATSLILCDYSHLLTDKSSKNIWLSPTWDKRNRVAIKHGTARSNADSKARQSQSPPQTCCEEVTHLSRVVRLLSFHCILNYTHVCRATAGTSGFISTQPQPAGVALIPLVPRSFKDRRPHCKSRKDFILGKKKILWMASNP